MLLLGVAVRLFTTIAGLRCYLDLHRPGNFLAEGAAQYAASPIGAVPDVGLVPTMGALHAGHLSLIQRARRENKIVVVSIFVNPLQFGPHEDLQRYPRSLERDRLLCEEAGVDVLFVPDPEEMGIAGSMEQSRGSNPATEPATTKLDLLTQVVPPAAMTSILCGQSRINHFQGVATIVTKLLNLVQPNRAYFGRKDAQQLVIIQQMVKDLNMPVEIIPCTTVREESGLAMSSRNQYLSEVEREQAGALYRGLKQAEQAFQSGERSSVALISTVKAELETVPAIAPEYIELVHPTTLAPLETVEEAGLLAIAARLGTTRLIDNILLCNRQPIVAIDGPAGAGKSTVARKVAETLHLLYLDTGAMYRALTWLVLQSGVAINDEPAVAELVSQCQIEVRSEEAGVRSEGIREIEAGFQSASDTHSSAPTSPPPRPTLQILINGQEVTQEIRSLEVTSQVSVIAAQPAVREELVKQQRRYGKNGGIVIEGRDIGTHVFPDAEVKIYLTASVQERARRRQQDLKTQGKDEISLDLLEQAIYERDRKDSTRALAPLRKAADAIEIQSDHLTIDEVVDRIVQIYQERSRLGK
ncbi:pantoate--beta-alanine ligase [Leptothermofonsia sichuanensis E412]|uniref:pantoate--beta-alanine ligase n=1 Tax=Leptothermofonsia sichuanensis TaxID=2917832 RepID=UPI001CA612F9|nr:pantoate--beta-alanine ligase [Leptothermofonsia sichuanensis E412]